MAPHSILGDSNSPFPFPLPQTTTSEDKTKEFLRAKSRSLIRHLKPKVGFVTPSAAGSYVARASPPHLQAAEANDSVAGVPTSRLTLKRSVSGSVRSKMLCYSPNLKPLHPLS